MEAVSPVPYLAPNQQNGQRQIVRDGGIANDELVWADLSCRQRFPGSRAADGLTSMLSLSLPQLSVNCWPGCVEESCSFFMDLNLFTTQYTLLDDSSSFGSVLLLPEPCFLRGGDSAQSQPGCFEAEVAAACRLGATASGMWKILGWVP